MKRLIAVLSLILMIVILPACGQKETAPTWQEQYDLGIRYLSEGNYEEAIIAFTAAIEIDPKQADAYISLAEAYTGAGDADAAKKALEDGFAATGSEEIQSLLDELAAMGEEPQPEGTPIPSEDVSTTLELSGLTYRYETGGLMAEINDGAVGSLYLNFAAHGPAGLRDVRISTWWNERLSDDIIQEEIPWSTAEWRRIGMTERLEPEQGLPIRLERGRPVDAEDLGLTQYILLIGLNAKCESVGYAVVPVQIPG